MIFIRLHLFLLFLMSFISGKTIAHDADSNFIKTQGTSFVINNKPYYFIGANFWAGMNLGALHASANRKRLIRELDRMKAIGVDNLRIMALTEMPNSEPYRIVPANNNKSNLNESILLGLDFLLTEMKKRKMYAVVCLSNFWPWSGGFAQYQQWVGDIVNIAYPMDVKNGNWDKYMKQTAQFYSSDRAIDLYKKSIQKIINRRNKISQQLYKNDPTIMSWQLCNEPRGMNNLQKYLQWINDASTFIKYLDPKHLVSIGSEGLTPDETNNGTPFIASHSFKNIDYTTAHLWIQNWGYYDPKRHNETYTSSIDFAKKYIQQHIDLSEQLNKPFVLEEFGIMKDNGSYDPNAGTTNRDNYFQFIFNDIYQYALQKKASGVNFWAWSGEARPRANACWWKLNDDLTGDPPHEQQGWYSVYDIDTSTHRVIYNYSNKMMSLKDK